MKSLDYYTAQHHCTHIVLMAVKAGILPSLKEKDVPCVDCGYLANQYDHRDYEKPLDVVPVCGQCNARRGAAKFEGRIPKCSKDWLRGGSPYWDRERIKDSKIAKEERSE